MVNIQDLLGIAITWIRNTYTLLEKLFNFGGNTMSTKSTLSAFLIGGLVGAAAALLYAPHSGDETRRMLMDNSVEVKDKALLSINEAQDMTIHKIQDLQKQVETLDRNTRERITKLENVAQDIVNGQRITLEKGVTKVKEVLSPQTSNN